MNGISGIYSLASTHYLGMDFSQGSFFDLSCDSQIEQSSIRFDAIVEQLTGRISQQVEKLEERILSKFSNELETIVTRIVPRLIDTALEPVLFQLSSIQENASKNQNSTIQLSENFTVLSRGLDEEITNKLEVTLESEAEKRDAFQDKMYKTMASLIKQVQHEVYIHDVFDRFIVFE
jgi:hypothetical protein